MASLCILLLALSGSGLAQSKRALHWYFGKGAGIDFTTGSARIDVSSQMIASEGSSTMSDEAGNLLFYSNGEQVWNRNHTLMPNGTAILGDVSSTQSTLIVPLPGNSSIYYLFSGFGETIHPNSGLYYNIVDMTLDGGLGDITSDKNVLLMKNGTEQLAGTQHCNGSDYWIVSRQLNYDSLKLMAWRLTKKGLNAPVVSSIALLNRSLFGSLTFSQDGRLCALATFGVPFSPSEVFLYDFDNRTGQFQLKNRIKESPEESIYSVAFSPDNTRLYSSGFNLGHTIRSGSYFHFLSQFDITGSNPTATRVDLDSIDALQPLQNNFGQLRLGPDQQIYVSRSKFDVDPATNTLAYRLDSIDIIHVPNAKGLDCRYQRNALWLQNTYTILGLPGFISNYTLPKSPPPAERCVFFAGNFIAELPDLCNGSIFRFKYSSYEADSIRWDFGDPMSGPDNTSTDTIVSHHYAQQGNYTALLTVYNDDGMDTVLRQPVRVERKFCDVMMPNAFSPDGNGTNDVFRLLHGDNITRFRMEIFNRWGQQVFSATDHRAGWDGRCNGVLQPPGLYIWSVIYDTPQLKNQQQRGTLLLVR
ncbi:MAG: gliding motility-associated C-terminal domain-containing protein [Bacteroidetes bacterium]|nr:gliding motility-associated C-terminal domain-containing protein [Bacteroidota bacterium]